MEPTLDIFGSVIEEGMDVAFNPPKYKGLAHGLIVKVTGEAVWIIHNNRWVMIRGVPVLGADQTNYPGKNMWRCEPTQTTGYQQLHHISRRACHVAVNPHEEPNRGLAQEIKRMLGLHQD